MSIIVVTSQQPGEGKTGVAAAIARHYAYLGRPVTLSRVASETGSAATDAQWFQSLDFVPGSPLGAVAAANVSDPGGEGIAVVEAGLEDAKAIDGAIVVFVARREVPKAAPAGIAPKAIIATDVPQVKGVGAVAGEGPLVVEIGEDRTLAGFGVEDAKAALNAEYIVPGDSHRSTCDHLVISPISSDAGQPHVRRFHTKAVVVRYDKNDQHLAAMRGEPEFLILTGGRMPSGYLFDAAAANGVPVLLSRTDTENTVIALEGLFDNTPFRGERKLDRMSQLLEDAALYDALDA